MDTSGIERFDDGFSVVIVGAYIKAHDVPVSQLLKSPFTVNVDSSFLRQWHQ